jgi:hypothetical protein
MTENQRILKGIKSSLQSALDLIEGDGGDAESRCMFNAGNQAAEAARALHEFSGQLRAKEDIKTMFSSGVNRETIFKAMEKSGFARTSSCCDRTLEKMCQGDEYRGNMEGFVGALLRLLGLRK